MKTALVIIAALAVALATGITFAPPAIADDDAELSYAGSFYVAGYLTRSEVVCPGEEAVRTARAVLGLLVSSELKAIWHGFPKKTKRWMLEGAYNFNAAVMKDGISAACEYALKIRDEAEQPLRPE
jgi:hypothetical protein